ncbi:hypothetical protein O3P69_000729 [Scylla paramamosain]|uniref:Secreted protein n=1 Tax=Scylla paramamosain TaxID=85552 RepID=A0AAW0UTF0_SCYPA
MLPWCSKSTPELQLPLMMAWLKSISCEWCGCGTDVQECLVRAYHHTTLRQRGLWVDCGEGTYPLRHWMAACWTISWQLW